jgi:hypothetical protein
MAIIKSGATSDELTVDPTSKAARTSTYDSGGVYIGPKATYRAAVLATVVAAAGAAMFFVISGSGTKTIRVQRIRFSGTTLTAVAYNTIVAEKWSTAPTAGTATVLTMVPLDSVSSAATAALCQVYTAAPTEGTLVGTLTAVRIMMQATTAAAAGIPDVVDLDFRGMGGETTGVVLRGTGQALSLAFGAAPATAVTLAVEVEWTEE